MFVESYDRFDDVGDYDAESGNLVEFSRSHADGRDTVVGPVRGHFARVDGVLAVLYRDRGVLWLRLGEHVREFDSGRSEVRWERSGKRARMRVVDEGEQVTSVEYVPGPWKATVAGDDPTPFVEREDWDFGLFVYNVLTDDGRRHRIYTVDSAP